jgi:hypothetical protein
MLGKRAQVSIDLLVSYGIAILVITIALYTVLQLGVFNSRLAPEYCNATPSFSCDGVALTNNGVLTIIFSQTTGGTMYITGASCSGTQNSVTGGPGFGNVNVLPESVVPSYYPANQLQSGIVAYSGSGTRVTLYCYSGSGVAKGNIGNSFTGTVWINYTLTELPNTLHTVQQLATFTERYSSSAAQPTTTSTSITTTSSTATSTSSTTSSVGSTTIYYVPVTLTNSQTSPTPSPFQEMLTINSQSYSAYINSNWNNVEFTTGPDGTGTVLQAWVESGASNGAASTVVWVNIPYSIAASSTNTINMDFMGGSVMSPTGPTGEAPQLSTPYAQNDNGARVFTNYWNFAGTSLPSGWTSSNAVSVNNGVPIPAGSVYTTAPVFSSLNNVEEMYAEYTSLNSAGYAGIMQSNGQAPSGDNGGSNAEILWMTNQGANLYYVWSADGTAASYTIQNGAASSFTPSLNTFYVLGTFVSPTTVGETVNYATQLSASGTYSKNQYMILGYFEGSASGSTSINPIFVQWVRTRAYPPNGAMPGASSGGVVGARYPGSFSAEFMHENAITINTAKVPSSQTGFPLLISGTYPFLANTANGGDVQSGINGYDIVFANDIYGFNALNWQVESYNGATGAANIWVNTPVSSTASTVIYMFYGNSIINSFQSNPAMVWNGNYLGVYHFSSNAGALSAADSTSHGATGTITGTTATSSGIIDGAGAYTGDGTFIVIPSASINTALESPAWSVSEWFYMNSGGQGQVFGAVPYWSNGGLGLGNNVGSCGTAFWVVMDEEQCVTSTTAPSTGAWHYMTLTYNNLNSNLNVLYMDGTPVASTSFNWYGAAPSQPSMVYATSGNTASVGQGISGNIDELEISNAALSANWIQTEYNNQYSPSTFYSISYIS